jgi:hypothetical protein
VSIVAPWPLPADVVRIAAMRHRVLRNPDIVHLFRSYAEEPSLFSRPFTAERVAHFRAGRVPDGEL